MVMKTKEELIKIFKDNPAAMGLLKQLTYPESKEQVDTIFPQILEITGDDYHPDLDEYYTDLCTEMEYNSYGGGLENFEKELMDFIKNHAYTKAHEAGVMEFMEDGDKAIELHTVNGEFERLIIKVITIG